MEAVHPAQPIEAPGQEHDIVVPESPDEAHLQPGKSPLDDCPQLPYTPGAKQQQQLQQSSAYNKFDMTDDPVQHSRLRKQFNLNAEGQKPCASPCNPAAKHSAESSVTADRDNHAARDREYSPSSDDADEDEDEDSLDEDASDADWSPEQPDPKRRKGCSARAKDRTPVKTPSKQIPFPQIQHDPEQIKRLTSPTKNRSIADCFAAMQQRTAHTPHKAPASTQQAAAAAAASGSGAAGAHRHANSRPPVAVTLTAAAAAAAATGRVADDMTVDLISDGCGDDDDDHVDNANDNGNDSDVEITGEVLSQQALQQQQQQQQQQGATQPGLSAGGIASLGATQARRNLSVTRIKERAAAAKAAKLAAGSMSKSQLQEVVPAQRQAGATTAAALTAAVFPATEQLSAGAKADKATAAAAAAGDDQPTARTAAADVVSGDYSFLHSSQPYTPVKTPGKTPISQQQQQQQQQFGNYHSRDDTGLAEVVVSHHHTPGTANFAKRAADCQIDAAAGDDDCSRKRQRTDRQLNTANMRLEGQQTAAAAGFGQDLAPVQCEQPMVQGQVLQVPAAAVAEEGMHNDSAAAAASILAVVADAPSVQPVTSPYVIGALGIDSEQEIEPDHCLLAQQAAADADGATETAEQGAAEQLKAPHRLVGVSAGDSAAAACPDVPWFLASLRAVSDNHRDEQAAANAGSRPASSSAAMGLESVVTTEVAGDDKPQTAATAAAAVAVVVDTTAAAGGSCGDDMESSSSLVLDHIQLLPSDHLMSWPTVQGRDSHKRSLPRFTFTTAAKEHLSQLVKSCPNKASAPRSQVRSPAASRSKKGRQRGSRGRAAGAAAISSPRGAAAAASDDGDTDADVLPFPELLDSEKGVFMNWQLVPKGSVVYMEFLADGQVFHQFKQQYTDIFQDARKRQQLSSNILVGLADSCHPCNHNPFEPLLTQQQYLQQLQQQYQQAQQQQQDAMPVEQKDHQSSTAVCQQQQHAVGRLLLAARDLDENQLLGMYIPGQSGYMLTSEDDERNIVDLSCEGIMHPYSMTFDFHRPAESELPAGQDDFVMCKADPSSCIMALINDSTEWTQQMQQLGKPCLSRAQMKPGSCTCHKYKGRSDNTFIVQCVYKAHDDTPVPVALFFTSRPVMAKEELLWRYDGEGDEAGAYFSQQKIERAQRTYVQLEAAMRQMTLLWQQEDQVQLLNLLQQQPASVAGLQSAAMLEYAKQRMNSLQARLSVSEHVTAKLAYLRSSCLLQKVLGPAPDCDSETAAAAAAACAAGMTAGSSSDNTEQQRGSKRSRVRQGLRGAQQALMKQLVERQTHMVDPVSAVDVALSEEQLAGQPLPPHWRSMLERLQHQVQQEQQRQQAVRQDLQQLQDVMQQCLLQSVQQSSREVDIACTCEADGIQHVHSRHKAAQQVVQPKKQKQSVQQHANLQVTTSAANGVASVDSAAGSVPRSQKAEEHGPSLADVLTANRKQLAAVRAERQLLKQTLQAKTTECDGLISENAALQAQIAALQNQLASQSAS